MTREIKFRGLSAKGEWVVGDLLRNRGEMFIAPPGIANPLATLEDFRVDPATVGQFIGHFGRNRQEVYEGDRVTYIKADGKERVGVIKYHVDGFDIYNDGVMDCSLRGLGHDCIEVIGNIHDTPELLNQKQS